MAEIDLLNATDTELVDDLIAHGAGVAVAVAAVEELRGVRVQYVPQLRVLRGGISYTERDLDVLLSAAAATDSGDFGALRVRLQLWRDMGEIGAREHHVALALLHELGEGGFSGPEVRRWLLGRARRRRRGT